jgi:hypothetical protein
MTKEIRILLEEKNPYRPGNCFEKIVRNILETQRYIVRSDINYTGMEIDLIAKHKDREETIYVECKAKEKVSSDELSKFAFNVSHKRADQGLFIRTKELGHQAAGLLDEMTTDDRYKNLTFFEASKVISLLQESDFIKPYKSFENLVFSKEILAVTYLGDFYVLIIKDSLGAIPSQVLIINAKNGICDNSSEINDFLKERISEISNLEIVTITSEKKALKTSSQEKPLKKQFEEIESISEVQETKNWFDYLPASEKHFVGREKVRGEILSFFNDVLENTTKRRLFYLTGKSGWGKSSLVAELRSRSRNKFYRNKFFTVAIDSRSALSSNFVALSFERLIKQAIKSGFIEQNLFSETISFASSYDLLSTTQIQNLFTYLKEKNKVLILIFDQFEDVFRKDGLFKAFYKFLSDTTDLRGNLIIGFSWKTEILIPSENEAYHYWQQSKEQAEHFTIPEFGSKETNLLISHLEKSIGKIDLSLKRRLVESSQGYPWLLKKLCVHIYEQINSGKNKNDIINENLNFEHLFNTDLELLSDEETKYLKYIAQRAFDGNFFETTEVNDTIPESIINTLRDDKRLIIRSGLNYNIYWDIFRDYLVNGYVPQIGESYIIRSSVHSCLEIFLLFNTSSNYSLKNIQTSLSKNIQIPTIENCLIDLRSIGLLRKNEKTDNYQLANSIKIVSESIFKKFITDKFQYNTLYHLTESEKGTIDSELLIKLLKIVFKGYSYQDKTWRIYANYFLNWLKFSNLEISLRVTIIGRGKGRTVSIYKNTDKYRKTAHLRMSPENLIEELYLMKDSTSIDLPTSLSRELIILDLLDIDGEELTLKTELKKSLNDKEKIKLLIANSAYKINRLNKVCNYLESNKKAKSSDIGNAFPDFVDSNLKPSSKKQYFITITRWAKFTNNNVAQQRV